jgi:hypothetical protein
MAERDPDCLFCKIVAGELPATIVAEDDRTVSFMDIHPATRGHALVVPRAHAADLLAIGEEDLSACAAAAKRLAARAKDALGAEGVNLLNGLPFPPARDPALPRRSVAPPLGAGSRRRRRDRRCRRGAARVTRRRGALRGLLHTGFRRREPS